MNSLSPFLALIPRALISTAACGRCWRSRSCRSDNVKICNFNKKASCAGSTCFTKAGGRDIWFVLTLADDLMDGPFAVVPLSEGANRQTLEGLFVAGKHGAPRDGLSVQHARHDRAREGGLIFAPDRSLERLRKFHGATRPVPKSALEAVAGAEVRLFVLPSDDQRRVLREFLRDPQAERTIVERMPPGTVPAEFQRDRGRSPV